MTDPKQFLLKLHHHRNLLQERAAKHSGNPPPELVNQIEDYAQAITLTEQAIAGQLTAARWLEALQPLLVAGPGIDLLTVWLLSQYAFDQGVMLGQTIGPQALDVAKEIFSLSMDHLRQSPKGVLIAAEFEQDPLTYEKPVEKAVGELIRADTAFAEQLKILLEQLHQALKVYNAVGSTYQVIQRGVGQVVQGKRAIGIQKVDQSQVTIDGSIGGDVLGPMARKKVEGDKIKGEQVIVIKGNATFVTDTEAPVTMTAVDRQSSLGQYLQYVISRNSYLRLQGIRSGGRLVHIELDQIYITLRTTQERVVKTEESWLESETELPPGEMSRWLQETGPRTEISIVGVNQALKGSNRLVVLGDPGSGKTTLLRYLALLYARDLAEARTGVKEELGLPESGRLPILLPLRKIGNFLHRQPDDGTEGHAVLLTFLQETLANERIKIPKFWLRSPFAVFIFNTLRRRWQKGKYMLVWFTVKLAFL